MEDIKQRLAKNITDLRLLNGMTQMELAERLNYSDKTISKWERNESTPDLTVLVEMAELFGVSLDDLVRSECIKEEVEEKPLVKERKYSRRVIAYIAESCAWVVAVFAFILTTLIKSDASFQWLYIVYAMPIAIIVKLVFNTIWFNPRHNYIIISALMWSLLFSVHMTFHQFGVDVALIYLLGIVGQAVIILWSFINQSKK